MGNFFQFGTNDPYVPKVRAEEFFSAVSGEKKILFYEAGHGLNEQAMKDRVAWLRAVLGLR